MDQDDAVAKLKRLTAGSAQGAPLLADVLAERFPFGEGDWCGAESGERSLIDLDKPAWTCTLDAGHDPALHAAHGREHQVLVVWRG